MVAGPQPCCGTFPCKNGYLWVIPSNPLRCLWVAALSFIKSFCIVPVWPILLLCCLSCSDLQCIHPVVCFVTGLHSTKKCWMSTSDLNNITTRLLIIGGSIIFYSIIGYSKMNPAGFIPLLGLSKIPIFDHYISWSPQCGMVGSPVLMLKIPWFGSVKTWYPC